ncbi:MAG: DegT/DnrJ/EryC1/StrS family aminotransferase [Parcubacteria group bacterium]|nr:DegT/DnrJ/EryC1/StrS family aminotransferase [Parcubacteria group bacterium]
MKILFNDFSKNYRKEGKEINHAIERVLKSGYYILGKEVENFEKSFASYLKIKNTIGVGNGMEALQIALMALDIKHGDEIITTPLSAVATVLAHKTIGAKTIFTDIDRFFHIKTDDIEKKITPRTKAIMPVHLYGQPADMDKIMAISKKHNLYVIEDCAQAHGAEFKGKKVGTFGTFGCFSFYPTKNLGAIGDGGAIVTNNNTLAEKCRKIRNYGQKNRYEHEIIGLNSRLDELQAAILSIKLKTLDKHNKRRREIASIYIKKLSNIKNIKLPELRNGTQHAFHLFVIETDKRDGLKVFLKKNGVDTLIHYPIPLHKQECFKEHNKENLPIVQEKTKKILSLPIHPYLKNNEVIYICEKIKSFYEI